MSKDDQIDLAEIGHFLADTLSHSSSALEAESGDIISVAAKLRAQPGLAGARQQEALGMMDVAGQELLKLSGICRDLAEKLRVAPADLPTLADLEEAARVRRRVIELSDRATALVAPSDDKPPQAPPRLQ